VGARCLGRSRVCTDVRIPSPRPRIVTVCHNSRETLRRGCHCVGLRMRIDGLGEGAGGVAKPCGDHCDRDALQVHESAARMPSVMQPHLPHTSPFEHVFPPRADRAGTQRRAGLVHHDVAARLVAGAEGQPVGGLEFLCRLERDDQVLGQRQNPGGCLRLRGALRELMAERDTVAGDRDCLCLQVDILPPQPGDLTPAAALPKLAATRSDTGPPLCASRSPQPRPQ